MAQQRFGVGPGHVARARLSSAVRDGELVEDGPFRAEMLVDRRAATPAAAANSSMLKRTTPRSRDSRAAASRIRAAVASTSSRRLGLISCTACHPARHDGCRDVRRRSAVDVLACRGVHTLRCPTAVISSSRSKTRSNSSRLRRAPQSSSSGSPCAWRRRSDEVGADLVADVVDDAAPAAVEPVGETQQRDELAQPLALVGVERRSAFRRLRVAAPVPAHERGEHVDLGGVEAAELRRAPRGTPRGGGGPWGHVLADVVEQRRVLEQLAVVGRRGRAARVWSKSASASRATWRCGPRGVAPPGQPGDRRPRGSRAGRRTSRRGRGGRIASSTMPSRSAHSLTVTRRTRTAPSRSRGTSTRRG